MQNEKGITYGNYSIEPSGYLISHIHWLNKIRKTTKEPTIVRGINISITILLCSYIESVLNELLNMIIEKRKIETSDKSYIKLLDNTFEKLNKASWTQYQEICEILLPIPINRYTNNEIWKGISILFNLRNIIVHGKAIKSKLFYKNEKFEVEYSGIFERAMLYFKEQKVLKPNQIKSSKHKILSTQATIHFIKITDKFVDEIFNKISDEQKINRMFISISYKDNYLLNHGIDPQSLIPKKSRKKPLKDDLPF